MSPLDQHLLSYLIVPRKNSCDEEIQYQKFQRKYKQDEKKKRFPPAIAESKKETKETFSRENFHDSVAESKQRNDWTDRVAARKRNDTFGIYESVVESKAAAYTYCGRLYIIARGACITLTIIRSYYIIDRADRSGVFLMKPRVHSRPLIQNSVEIFVRTRSTRIHPPTHAHTYARTHARVQRTSD